MRTFKACFVLSSMLFACGPTMAQGLTSCADDPPGASNPSYRTCLTVSNSSPEVGSEVNVVATLFSVPAGGFNIATSFSLYDGGFHLLTQNTSVHQSLGNALSVNFIFTSVGTVQLRADPAPAGRLDSPTIPITVRKFSPQYSMSAPSTALIGQSIPLTTNTTLHRPSGGVLAFYVIPPGGNASTATEFARKNVSVTGPGSVTDVDSRSFSFAAPYDVPGEYRFLVQYLGDGFNSAGYYSSYRNVRVGPFPTGTALTQSVETSVSGKPVTLTATVTAAAGGISAPTGNVEFFDGTTLLGTTPLASGSAVLVTTQLRAAGNRTLTARYVGDTWNSASTSPALAHATKIDPASLVPIIDLIVHQPQSP
jgi:hypothetical protein